ncbi:alpha/beta fold hydrolase [Gangjinia marincola]|uniref:Proline iminopeptidase n=1 Tax=Gangjinia marincola TaxID=578463 RepID=A0ABN1MGJ8_9FLAO
MIHLRCFILFFIVSYCSLKGQELTIQPHEFISKTNDTVQAELGTFRVPLNRSNTDTTTIPLSFIRFKSTNPNPASPIVYLAGGPGGSGSETAKRNRFELFMKLREVGDVIAFDQRGTGLSYRPINCDEKLSFAVDRPVLKDEYVKRTIAMYTKCIEFWKENNQDFYAFNTAESAADIEALRKVLTAEKISLWGISYGSHLAFKYIRRYEDKVDRAVLASLEGPDQTIKLPQHTDDFIERLSKRAETNYGEQPTYPALLKTIRTVHDKFKNNDKILTYTTRRGDTAHIGISLFELQQSIAIFYLKNPNNSKALSKLYTDMSNRNYDEIAPKVEILKRWMFRGERLMPIAMDLQSGISRERSKLYEKQVNEALLGDGVNFLAYEWMNSLPYQMLPDDFRELKTNHVSALLLSGDLDGRTYIPAAKEIAKHFKNGQHIIVQNAGHDLYMASDEIQQTVVDFFGGKQITENKLSVAPVPFN